MNGRCFYDRLYGKLDLPPLLAGLCATREFHRLDDVRQLGGCAFVYPSATHTRREHSMGVAHLAGVMGHHLRQQRPDLVDEDDVLCLQVAGLLHDLGHGPYSHLFEDFARLTDPTWSHEWMGILLLRRMLEGSEWSQGHFQSPGPEQAAFVELLILGLDADAPWPEERVGRSERKRFLLDVVHNHGSGIDVDKLDYLARDAMAVFGSAELDPGRLIKAVRVLNHEGKWTLGFEESVCSDIADLYSLRTRLHKRIYQHRAVLVVEGFLLDLIRAVDHATNGSITAALRDPEAFLELGGDSVVWCLARSSPRVKEAREKLHRRPWCIRLPVTACMRTQPSCSFCGSDTRVSDAYCAACGHSTKSRSSIGVPHPGGVQRSLLVPPGCTLTEEEATREVREMVQREDAWVHIVDVHCGSAVMTEDPHGRLWKEYDPVRKVLFCDKSGKPLRVDSSAPHLHVPHTKHIRTAHCYLPVGVDPADVEAATRGFVRWALSVGTLLEEEEQ